MQNRFMQNNIQNIYSCSKCGAQSYKWIGRCLECGAWGTMVEEVSCKNVLKKDIKTEPSEIIDFSNIKSKELKRFKTGMNESDRVFGGGIVPGSLVLLSGEPVG